VSLADSWDTSGATIFAVTQPNGAPRVAADPHSPSMMVGWNDEKTANFPKNLEFCSSSCDNVANWSHKQLIIHDDGGTDVKSESQAVAVVFFDGTFKRASAAETVTLDDKLDIVVTKALQDTILDDTLTQVDKLNIALIKALPETLTLDDQVLPTLIKILPETLTLDDELVIPLKSIGLVAYVNPTLAAGDDPANYRDVTDLSGISVAGEKELESAITYTWVEMDVSPTNGSRAISLLHEGTINGATGSGDLISFIFNNATAVWTSLTDLTTDGISLDLDPQSFDIEFETTTGDALVVYGKDTADSIYYRTMTEDEDDWSDETEITAAVGATGIDSTDPYWLRLYRDPASDDIMFVWEQSVAGGAFLQTSLWDGNSWGAVTDHGETVLIDGIKL